MLVHHHLIIQTSVNVNINKNQGDLLIKFMEDMVSLLEMEILIKPQVAYSNHDAWTGITGIVTSHISFHYWLIDQFLQLDIYSCKPFSKDSVISFIISFWSANDVKYIFLERDKDNFNINSNI